MRAFVDMQIGPLHTASQCPPEVICVKVPGELGIDVYDMHVSLCGVADDGLVVLARRGVGFDIDTESAVEFEFESKERVSICMCCVIIGMIGWQHAH